MNEGLEKLHRQRNIIKPAIDINKLLGIQIPSFLTELSIIPKKLTYLMGILFSSGNTTFTKGDQINI